MATTSSFAGGLATLWQLRNVQLEPSGGGGETDVWSVGVSRGVGVALSVVWLTVLVLGLVGRRFISWQVL